MRRIRTYDVMLATREYKTYTTVRALNKRAALDGALLDNNISKSDLLEYHVRRVNSDEYRILGDAI